jgi:hypothetical protein
MCMCIIIRVGDIQQLFIQAESWHPFPRPQHGSLYTALTMVTIMYSTNVSIVHIISDKFLRFANSQMFH